MQVHKLSVSKTNQTGFTRKIIVCIEQIDKTVDRCVTLYE